MGGAVEKANNLTRKWLVEEWYRRNPRVDPDADPGPDQVAGPVAEPVAGPEGSGSYALSAAGVWPLLAFLADGADDTGREELARAVGIPADDAASAARELLAVAEQSAAGRIALGLWTQRTVELREAWRTRLSPGVHGALTGDPATDQKHLDAWAAEHTGGLVPQLPIRLTPETRLVLAGALAVDVTWRLPFTERRAASTGPWAQADGRLPELQSSDGNLDALRVADTPMGLISALTVVGDGDVDVVLVLGAASMASADVLAFGAYLAGADVGIAATGRLTGPEWSGMPRTFGSGLAEGAEAPGVTVTAINATAPGDRLSATTVPFHITTRHDLLDTADLFGLRHVATPGAGRFPGVSDFPLVVNQAAQDTMASFTATGFRAAAVTAFSFMAGSAPRPTRVKKVSVVFDRPFAFYAVHRDSGLILVAGWVGEPGEPGEPGHDVSSGRA